MIQLPAGAAEAIDVHARDLGPGCRPGGVPGIHTRHSPALGRWPGGTPRVAAVLGPLFDPPDAVVDVGGRFCGLGSTTTVFVVRLQALRAQRPAAMRASRFKGPPPKGSDQM